MNPQNDWPNVPCPAEPVAGTVQMKLTEIQTLAQAAPGDPMAQQCNAKATQVMAMNPTKPDEGSNHVFAAWQKAQAGDWGACKGELDQVD